MSRDNIVLFLADQMRSDTLHHMGNTASVTPNLDGLLDDGLSFTNAYCQNPVCVPSRCSFLTGLYPHTTGHRTMHYLQREEEPNILKEMKANGYEVIWIGRNDVVPADHPKTSYCDEYYDGLHEENMRDRYDADILKNTAAHQNKPTMDINDDNYYSFYVGKMAAAAAKASFDWKCLNSALAYLERRKHSNSDKPFFLYVTLQYPHPPYACEDPWYSMIDRNALMPRRPDLSKLSGKPSMLYGIYAKQHMQSWTEERWNELRATYLAMVSRFDHQFGMLKDKLQECGYYDDTNIFVFADHGDYTGDYGIVEKVQNCFEDPIAKVPLLLKPAKHYACQPRKVESLTQLLDVGATVAEIAGFDISYTQFGKSMVHLFDHDEGHRDAVYCEGGRIHGETQCMELGHGPESPYYPRLSTQASEGPEHTKATMIRMGNYKYVKRLYESDEFYDLGKDEMELKNEITNPAYQETIHMMRDRLLDYFQSTTDFVPKHRDRRM